MAETAYCTAEELAEWMSATAVNFSMRAQVAIDSASREIDSYCGRRFWADDTPSARTYRPDRRSQLLFIDDCYDIDTVTVDGTAVAPSDYVAHPENGVRSGVDGWPVIYLAGDWHGTVIVTGRWGWAAVPAPVKAACLMLAAETFKAQDAPFGIAGFDGTGVAVRVRRNPLVAAKLEPYRDVVIA